MADYEFPRPCSRSDPGRIFSRRMEILRRKVAHIVAESGLVIEDVHSAHPSFQFGERSGIAAIGGAAGHIRLVSILSRFENVAVLAYHVVTGLERAYLLEGQGILLDELLADVERGFLLAEKKAVGLHLVVQGKRENLAVARGNDLFRSGGLQRNEVYVELDSVGEIVLEELQRMAECLGGIDVQRSRTAFQSHRREQRHYAEHVVAVEMRDENVLYLGVGDAVPGQQDLAAFGTVN